MRNPNGFGGIVDLGKNRRNRYAVRVTDTYASAALSPDGTFKQKYKYVGYYPTLKAAKTALIEYNSNNTTTQYLGIKFSEVWEIWKRKNLTDKNTSRYTSYTAAYKKCTALYNVPVANIRLNDLENIFEGLDSPSQSTIRNIKIVLNAILNWAEQNDVVNKNYANFLNVKNCKQVENHKAFASADVERFWKEKEKYMVVLMYIYTGCRPSELIELKVDNIHIDEGYFYIAKSKTKAGIRYVPIADKIKPFFEYYLNKKNKTLFDFNYLSLKKFYKENFKEHTPHSTRSTCVSLLTSAGVSETIIQKIVGHKGGNVTRDVYTQLELEALRKAINKI